MKLKPTLLAAGCVFMAAAGLMTEKAEAIGSNKKSCTFKIKETWSAQGSDKFFIGNQYAVSDLAQLSALNGQVIRKGVLEDSDGNPIRDNNNKLQFATIGYTMGIETHYAIVNTWEECPDPSLTGIPLSDTTMFTKTVNNSYSTTFSGPTRGDTADCDVELRSIIITGDNDVF